MKKHEPNAGWKVKESFGFFDTTPQNINWSWSAINDSRLVVSVYIDHFFKFTPQIGYENFHDTRFNEPGFHFGSLGSRYLRKDLLLAKKKFDGRFNVIIMKSDNMNASRRNIKWRYPHPTLVMQLSALDDVTGQFKAFSVDGHFDDVIEMIDQRPSK